MRPFQVWATNSKRKFRNEGARKNFLGLNFGTHLMKHLFDILVLAHEAFGGANYLPLQDWPNNFLSLPAMDIEEDMVIGEAMDDPSTTGAIQFVVGMAWWILDIFWRGGSLITHKGELWQTALIIITRCMRAVPHYRNSMRLRAQRERALGEEACKTAAAEASNATKRLKRPQGEGSNNDFVDQDVVDEHASDSSEERPPARSASKTQSKHPRAQVPSTNKEGSSENRVSVSLTNNGSAPSPPPATSRSSSDAPAPSAPPGQKHAAPGKRKASDVGNVLVVASRDLVVRSGPVFGDFTKTKDQTSRSGPVLGYCRDRTAQRPRPWSGPGLGAVLVRPDQCMGRSESGSMCERVEKVAGVTAWPNKCRYSEG
jgi:hypothetical protein